MKFITYTLLLLVCVGQSTAQNPAKEQRPEKTDDVVVVNTNLVQVDAIVTDKSGKQVSDLKADDFEVLENGRAHEIKAFSYIPLTSEKPIADDTKAGDREPARRGPPPTLHAERPEQVRRTIAILIDDFGLSAESIARLRGGLEKFIEEKTSPGDLIAIIRASGGPGAMQQFTSNRTQLLATIKRLRWYVIGRGRMSGQDSMSPVDDNEDGVQLQGYSSSKVPNLSSKEYFPGSLAALGYVIHGMTRFPGRKSIVLISDNLPVTTKDALSSGGLTGLDKMIEHANQHSIVISTMDARGLPKAFLTADDSQYNLAANQVDTRIRTRNMRFTVEQDTLSYIARQTGGVFVRDDTDLTHALSRIVDSEQGYYLIGYRPDDVEKRTAGSAGYKVTLRLKRPDLQIRTRSSFHRTEIPAVANAPEKTKSDWLREALTSPFVREGVHLKTTALYTGGSQVKILLHVDAQDMELTQTPEGNYTGTFDIIAVAFDNNGKVANEVGQSQAVRITKDRYQQLQREGFVHLMTMQLAKPGPYQIRVALRDVGSGHLGSDSQFVEVPDVKTSRLAIAGFIVQSIAPSNQHSSASSGTGVATEQRAAESSSGGTATRRFEAGDMLNYSYLIYGARKNGASLVSQARLFRADKEVFKDSLQPVTTARELVHEGIVAIGSLKLSKELPPGEYFLQIIVTDKLAPADKQSSDQWIDFEIVE
jgi:VWFA-related protein